VCIRIHTWRAREIEKERVVERVERAERARARAHVGEYTLVFVQLTPYTHNQQNHCHTAATSSSPSSSEHATLLCTVTSKQQQEGGGWMWQGLLPVFTLPFYHGVSPPGQTGVETSTSFFLLAESAEGGRATRERVSPTAAILRLLRQAEHSKERLLSGLPNPFLSVATPFHVEALPQHCCCFASPPQHACTHKCIQTA